MLRHDWSYEDIKAVYDLPFPDLIFKAQLVHRENFSHLEVQRSTLLSVKTGGCPENCAYCPQSAHYDTGLEKHQLLPAEVVLVHAREAKSQGSTRFCMGAAWREVKDGAEFDNLVDIVNQVHNLGLEVCCTLGMLNADQAKRLKDAGCYAYNHNLDTSPEYYSKIITTRTYQDRLDTIDNVRASGMTVCCGGIVGLGENAEDRIKLIKQLSSLNPHPESVPVNMLVQVEGTPLKGEETIDPIDFIRMIAVARIVMPKSMVRLSAGRKQMSDELQALAFCAGANSIFAGEKLLTTLNPTDDHDRRLLNRLGMKFVERASNEEDTIESAACQTSCFQTS